MRTGTLRCGYVVWPPYLFKDPNTGAFSGISYDLITAISEEAGIKVTWTEETGWGTFHEGLNSGRYDAMCVGVWQSGARARAALLTKPAYYDGLYAFSKEEDKRFSEGIVSLDKPDVRIVVHEGDATQALRRMKFPHAQELALSPMSDSSQGVLSVAEGKADIDFESRFNVAKYNEMAKVKLVPVEEKPVQLFGNSFAVKTGEYDLKFMLDSVIDTLVTSGKAEKILEPYKDSGFVAPAPGYKVE